jgi:hypothetical protein
LICTFRVFDERPPGAPGQAAGKTFCREDPEQIANEARSWRCLSTQPTVASTWELHGDVRNIKSNQTLTGTELSRYDSTVDAIGQRTAVETTGSAFDLLGGAAGRDPIEDGGGWNLYGFVGNRQIGSFDVLGRDWGAGLTLMQPAKPLPALSRRHISASPDLSR